MSRGKDTRRTEADGHELAYFIRVANEACSEAVQKLAQPLSFLAGVDLLYMDFLKAAGGIRPATASILLMNAHASFRAGVRLALSGQLLPVFMTLRGSIESALYAHALVVNPELQTVWLMRDKDDDSRRMCRQAFSAAKVFQCLERADEKDFADRLRYVYDSTIDFGAHPNSRSLVSSIRVEQSDDGSHAMDFAYIHGVGSFELRQSVVACGEIGLAVFFVALLCFEGHPCMVQLNQRALELQEKVSAFIEELGLSAPTKSN